MLDGLDVIEQHFQLHSSEYAGARSGIEYPSFDSQLSGSTRSGPSPLRPKLKKTNMRICANLGATVRRDGAAWPPCQRRATRLRGAAPSPQSALPHPRAVAPLRARIRGIPASCRPCAELLSCAVVARRCSGARAGQFRGLVIGERWPVLASTCVSAEFSREPRFGGVERGILSDEWRRVCAWAAMYALGQRCVRLGGDVCAWAASGQ